MDIETEIKKLKTRLEKLEKKNFDGTYDENYQSQSAREHASEHEGDKGHHFLGIRNLDSAKQKISSFKNQYDEGSVKNLHGNELDQYQKELNIVNELARIWSLPAIESLKKN